MNHDKPKTPAEAAQMVARLKMNFRGPYTLLRYCVSGTVEPSGDPDEFLSQFNEPPPDISAQRFENLTQLLNVWRTFWPVGDFLFILRGQTPGYKNPMAFIDTPVIEKAIAHRTRERHTGTI